MHTKIEGLIIHKFPYRERDLICRLLLRSGRKISLIFYGGRSGGSGKRSVLLEIGYLISVEIRRPKIISEEKILEAKEWTLKWAHHKIRESVKAFYLLCFYVEVVDKISQKEDLLSLGDVGSGGSDTIGIFRVLSNALFFLDNSLRDNSFDDQKFFAIFLGKLIFEMGVAPDLLRCIYCGSLFNLQDNFLTPRSFIIGEGGFSCYGCVESNGEKRDDWGFFKFLNMLKRTPYADNGLLPNLGAGISRMLFNHLSYHCNLKDVQFNTLKNLI